MITVKNLKKDYVLYKHKEGLVNSVKEFFYREKIIKTAINNISFEINKGEIVGYIGPNGAGKSTTIKMLVGILTPTSGEIYVNGLAPHKKRELVTKDIGIVFGNRSQLWWDIPVIETYKLIKYMYNIDDQTYHQNIERFKELLEIDKFLKIPVRKLSLGERMRVELCASMLYNPSILLLDEPTIGLDIVAKEKIRNFIREVNACYNCTIILTTHDILDIDRLCNRIIILNEGSIIYDKSLSELKNKFISSREIIIELIESSDKNIYDSVFLKLQQHGFQLEKIDAKRIKIIYDNKDNGILETISGFLNIKELKDIVIKDIELEDIIKKIYTEDKS